MIDDGSNDKTIANLKKISLKNLVILEVPHKGKAAALNQGLIKATLVAQGAFSIYRKSQIIAAGGWPESVGEDIVLTWGLIKNDCKIGFSESAFAFTFVPSTYKKLFLQRSR